MHAHADEDRLALCAAGASLGDLVGAVMDDGCARQGNAQRLHHRALQIGLGVPRRFMTPPPDPAVVAPRGMPCIDHHQQDAGVLAFLIVSPC